MLELRSNVSLASEAHRGQRKEELKQTESRKDTSLFLETDCCLQHCINMNQKKRPWEDFVLYSAKMIISTREWSSMKPFFPDILVIWGRSLIYGFQKDLRSYWRGQRTIPYAGVLTGMCTWSIPRKKDVSHCPLNDWCIAIFVFGFCAIEYDGWICD